MARIGAAVLLLSILLFNSLEIKAQEGQPQPPPQEQPPQPPPTEPQPEQQPHQEHPWEKDLHGHPPQIKDDPEMLPPPGPALPMQIERYDTLGISRRLDGLFYSISYGWQGTRMGQLNNAMQALNFPTFDEVGVSIGIGIYKTFGAFMAGGEGALAFFHESNTAIYDGSLSSGLGFAQIGYRIISSSSVLLYPLVGIGGGVTNLSIAEKAPNQSFNQVMSGTGRSVDISTGNVMINLSLNLNYFTREVTISGFHFGVTAGYYFALPSQGWYTFNDNVVGGPGFDLSGPYLKLRFGGGSFKEWVKPQKPVQQING
jgi:hypothetical protein